MFIKFNGKDDLLFKSNSPRDEALHCECLDEPPIDKCAWILPTVKPIYAPFKLG